MSLAEVRLQCKVNDDDTSHDDLLKALSSAAREFAEHYTGRALATQTLELALDAFPSCGAGFELAMPPVASITSIKYTDPQGVEQTLATGAYALSTYGLSRTVSPAYGSVWPATLGVPDAVRVRYIAGYPDGRLPMAVKAAMLLHVEVESPLNPHTPTERAAKERARDALLDTVKIWNA